MHPLIESKIKAQAELYQSANRDFLIDIPLFFETGAKYKSDGVIVVYTPKELQIKRLMQRDLIDEKEAKRRVEVQIDIEEKRKLADFVIDNSKDLKHLTKEVERVYASIKV